MRFQSPVRRHSFSPWQKLMGLLPSSHYALLSLFFFGGLEVIFGIHRFIPLLVSILFIILLIGIILVRAEEGERFHSTQTILPALTAIGLTGFALFLPTGLFIHLYFLLCAIVFFYVLKYGAKQAYPTWNWVISLLVLFATLATILGWRFHLYIPILEVVALVFTLFFLVSMQSLWRLTPSTSEALLLSLSTAFVLTEAAWTLQFLPLFYLVQTGVLVAIYYVLFHLVTISYESGIKPKDIVEYIIIGAGALLMILLSAQWI